MDNLNFHNILAEEFPQDLTSVNGPLALATLQTHSFDLSINALITMALPGFSLELDPQTTICPHLQSDAKELFALHKLKNQMSKRIHKKLQTLATKIKDEDKIPHLSFIVKGTYLKAYKDPLLPYLYYQLCKMITKKGRAEILHVNAKPCCRDSPHCKHQAARLARGKNPKVTTKN